MRRGSVVRVSVLVSTLLGGICVCFSEGIVSVDGRRGGRMQVLRDDGGRGRVTL